MKKIIMISAAILIVLIGIGFGYKNIVREKEYLEDQDISWTEAEELVMGCRVEKVFQNHALDVVITLFNDVQLKTIEPKIDDVVHIAVSAEEKCGNIVIGTE